MAQSSYEKDDMQQINDPSLTGTREIVRGRKLTRRERIEAQEKFLASFSFNANITMSCKIAEISRETFYGWQSEDQKFAELFRVAEQSANDVIRAEIHRRGVEGYEKPIVSMGRVVKGPDGEPLIERVYSDKLLELLAKARMPEYRDKGQLEVTGGIKITTEWGNAALEIEEGYVESFKT
jgi:hypothetical protein